MAGTLETHVLRHHLIEACKILAKYCQKTSGILFRSTLYICSDFHLHTYDGMLMRGMDSGNKMAGYGL